MSGLMKADVLEQVIVGGDLANLSSSQRTAYYLKVCESLGLNPTTKPFEFLKLSGRTVLYARRECTEQLRKRDHVSVTIVAREMVNGVYVVTARATTPDGRADESIGAVTVDGLKGEALSNSFMRAETKAKRRVTLSICGLGFLDESEVPAGAEVITNDGEILTHAQTHPVPELQAVAQDWDRKILDWELMLSTALTMESIDAVVAEMTALKVPSDVAAKLGPKGRAARERVKNAQPNGQ